MQKTKQLAYIALGAAVIALSAWLSIPAAVPFTMQTMAVLTVAGLFGARLGCASVGVYLLLGSVGAPVFAGFRGGLHVLLGATGGYLIGFLLVAVLTGWVAQRVRRIWQLALGMAGGMAALYAFGTLWYAALYANGGLKAILLTCVVPFLLPDAAKLSLALLLVVRLRRSIHI